jgi:hypothetical protein
MPITHSVVRRDPLSLLLDKTLQSSPALYSALEHALLISEVSHPTSFFSSRIKLVILD